MMSSVFKHPKLSWEIDEEVLAQHVRQAFVERFGEEAVDAVKVKRYPGDEYTVIVEVPQKTDAMRSLSLDLGKEFLDQGVSIAIVCREIAPKSS